MDTSADTRYCCAGAARALQVLLGLQLCLRANMQLVAVRCRRKPGWVYWVNQVGFSQVLDFLSRWTGVFGAGISIEHSNRVVMQCDSVVSAYGTHRWHSNIRERCRLVVPAFCTALALTRRGFVTGDRHCMVGSHISHNMRWPPASVVYSQSPTEPAASAVIVPPQGPLSLLRPCHSTRPSFSGMNASHQPARRAHT